MKATGYCRKSILPVIGWRCLRQSAWRPLRNCKLYSELLIDDITTSKLGTDFYGNKWGWIAGIFFVAPFTRHILDLRLEYARLRPYPYTHYRTSHNYTHYNSPLGYWTGPNSDNIDIRVHFSATRYLSFLLRSGRFRHGENVAETNVGGNISEGYRTSLDNPNAAFLDGHINTIYPWRMTTAYELFSSCYITLSYGNCYPDMNIADISSKIKYIWISIGINAE